MSSYGPLRVVLLGKTGNGKSSLGNTLLGRNAFRVERQTQSVTLECQLEKEDRFGTLLQVTDTPGVFDTNRDEAKVLKEIGKSVALSAPGPHVVLLVLRADVKFTKEENDAHVALKKLFGSGICKHMIVVFTHAKGDTPAEWKEDVDGIVRSATGDLPTIIEETGRRYCGITNSASLKNRDHQVQELLAMMQSLVSANGDKYFSNKLCEDITKEVEKAAQKRETGDKTHEEAMQDTKKAIAEGKVDDFIVALIEIIRFAIEMEELSNCYVM